MTSAPCDVLTVEWDLLVRVRVAVKGRFAVVGQKGQLPGREAESHRIDSVETRRNFL